MATEIRFCFILVSLVASSSFASSCVQSADESFGPRFAFSWMDDKSKFQAGETAAITIKVLGNIDDKSDAFKPAISVNGKSGNSSFISGVSLDVTGDPSAWKILFTPIMAGVFNVIISDEHFKVLDASLHYEAEPGQLYPSVCVASWMGLVNEFEAGVNATVFILPRDAFGNNISSARNDIQIYNFSVSILHGNGSAAATPNITKMGWNDFGYILMELVLVKSGNFLLYVGSGNQTLNGAPLPFKVNPGPLDVSNCVAKWKYEMNAWQVFSKMEFFLYQHDRYGNLAPQQFEFDADIVEEGTNLSIPLADLKYEYVEPGIQLFSFSVQEPGSFLLTITDMKHNLSISNMPYSYAVYVAYCDGSRSVVNGSGLNDSTAGDSAVFSIYLRDTFDYPSFIEVERLQVQIVRENDHSFTWPTIQPREILNGSGSNTDFLHGFINQFGTAPVPSSNASRSQSVQASIFDVNYRLTKSGIYGITLLCGNIVLNSGQPFKKEVKSGDVNVSLSSVIGFASKAPKRIKNDVAVRLLDSFANPVVSKRLKLRLKTVSANISGFTSSDFVDSNDGTYSGSYMATEAGTYGLCVEYDGNNLAPCPFEVNIYGSEYFPQAYDDTETVWEDESIAFDVLGNDYFAGENASIAEISHPRHGSLLQQGRLLRYTPYKDFSGHDSFHYTMCDANGNLASGAVNITVLTSPPQFVSFPNGLQATEDLISPRFSGFSGLEIRYSDPAEKITVNFSAEFGAVFLSPMQMQFRQPMWRELLINEGTREAKNLVIEGCTEAINIVLQSIQYLGNENFAGVDNLQLSTKNKNGMNKLDVPVFVAPVNDPPFINVPEYIVLRGSEGESLVFDRERDRFNFSVGDPDLPSYPGGDANFLVIFSMEVSDGCLKTNLPAELINSTEIKLESSYRWLPLQTYVAISKHFTVKGVGVRFQGTIKHCNDVMQQLFYHGGFHGAILTLKMSDMGRYGCYLDCTEKTSVPLHAKANVNLIRRRPMTTIEAHTLGTAIIIESLVVFALGMLLLFFTCKCAIRLVNERKQRGDTDSRPPSAPGVPNERPSTNSIEDKTYVNGCFPSARQRSGQQSVNAQRGKDQAEIGEASKGSRWSGKQSQKAQERARVMALEFAKGKTREA